MKGLEKLTSIRLAEVLSQKNVVPTDVISDALYTHDSCKDPFVEVLIQTGQITEWDLAKVVVEHFQLPFIMASNYEIPSEIAQQPPKEVLFRNLLVPLDVFGKAISIVMPIMTTHDVLYRAQREIGLEIYPYVGLLSENKKVLGDLFSGFKNWFQEHQDSRAKQRRQTKSGARKGPAAGGWQNIFDDADAAVRDGLKS